MRLLLICVFCALLHAPIYAQTALPNTESQPESLFEDGYLDLPEPLQVTADAEHKIIRYFFDFSCVYCRHIHDVMSVWSSTLHDSYTFVYHHVGVPQDQLYYLKAASMTYVANLPIPKNKKYQFMQSMFTHIKKVTTPEQMMRLVKEASTDIGLTIRPMAEYLISKESLQSYDNQIALQRQVALSGTPSILIGGRFFTHLGLADGRPELWIELINKVTSLHYYVSNNVISQTPASADSKKD
jgi:hypothetical protein